MSEGSISEVGTESGIPLVGTFQDFDWADEVLHARIGQKWYIPDVGDRGRHLPRGHGSRHK